MATYNGLIVRPRDQGVVATLVAVAMDCGEHSRTSTESNAMMLNSIGRHWTATNNVLYSPRFGTQARLPDGRRRTSFEGGA